MAPKKSDSSPDGRAEKPLSKKRLRELKKEEKERAVAEAKRLAEEAAQQEQDKNNMYWAKFNTKKRPAAAAKDDEDLMAATEAALVGSDEDGGENSGEDSGSAAGGIAADEGPRTASKPRKSCLRSQTPPSRVRRTRSESRVSWADRAGPPTVPDSADAAAGTAAPGAEAAAAAALAAAAAKDAGDGGSTTLAVIPRGALQCGTVGPELPVAGPHCFKCKTPVDPLSCRMTGKQSQVFECPTCNCKGVQLYRRFQKWPPSSFISLGPEWQETFWKDAAGCTSAAALEEMLVNTLTRSRMEKEEVSVGGKYLPLSVWAKKGYNTAAIEALCQDHEEHPILGRTYRILLKGVWSTTIEQCVRTEVLQSRRQANSASRSPSIVAKKHPAIQDKKRDRSPDADASSPPKKKPRREASKTRSPSRRRGRTEKRERSRSSSSYDKKKTKASKSSKGRSPSRRRDPSRQRQKGRSRSDDGSGDRSRDNKSRSKRARSESRRRDDRSGRRGRSRSGSREKRKREEKERKEAQKALVEAERADIKRKKENQQKAVRVLTKIQSILVSLERDVKDKAMKHVPEYGADPAKKSFQALKALKKRVRRRDPVAWQHLLGRGHVRRRGAVQGRGAERQPSRQLAAHGAPARCQAVGPCTSPVALAAYI